MKIRMICCLNKTYQIFSLLNLDVVTGVVGFTYLAASISSVEWPIYQVFILSSTVWIIYTLDRLLDNSKQHHITTTRHLFQFTYRKASLVLLFSLVFINLLILMINKPQKLIEGGIAVSAFLVLYFLFKHFLSLRKKSFLLKEIFIASGYAMGIMLLPYGNSDDWNLEYSILLIYLFIVAFINVLIIGSFEMKEDLLSGEKTLIHLLPSSWLKSICLFFSILAIILAVTLLADKLTLLALVGLPILLILPLFFKDKFLNKNLYRLWADGILMLPIPFLILDSFL